METSTVNNNNNKIYNVPKREREKIKNKKRILFSTGLLRVMHLFTWTRETLVHETSLSKTDPPLREGGKEGERRREREKERKKEKGETDDTRYTHTVLSTDVKVKLSHTNTHTHIQTKIPSLMECYKQFKKEASSAVCDSHINTVAIVCSSQTRPVYPLSLSLGDYQTIITHRIGQ